MAISNTRETLLLGIVVIIITIISQGSYNEAASGLSYDYYKETCPHLEDIVQREVERIYYIHGNAAVSFTRNIFHDCAVQGCDASLLLASTEGHPGEQESIKNFGLRNMKYVQDIKNVVENACPEVVSCADILILSGRDGIAMLGGPKFEVRTGRRDTRTFSLAAADAQLLPPDTDITTFLNYMAGYDINTAQAVAILGAHSVGRTHCKFLEPRLYPTLDPTLNSSYSIFMKKRCSLPKVDLLKYVRNDEITPMKIDNNYFKNIMQLKGSLKLDNALYLDNRTKVYVEKFAQDNNYFFSQFVEAISIISEYKVLTGSEGEIRRNCKWVN